VRFFPPAVRARRAAFLGAALGLMAADHAAWAADSTPTPFDGLGANLADAFSGTNLFFYAGAAASTFAFSTSGIDQEIRVATQQNLRVTAYGDATVIGGYLLPALVAPTIYVVGLFHDDTTAAAGAAAMQALAVTLATTALLKWTTGRPFPTHGEDPAAPSQFMHPNYSREFHPFNFDGAWAWPSGHISGTISIAAALHAFYPERPWIAAVGYPLSFAIGLGMIDGDHHWTSDVIAGALIGHAIGSTIGRNFRRMYREGNESHETDTSDTAAGNSLSWEIVPMVFGARGLAVRGAF